MAPAACADSACRPCPARLVNGSRAVISGPKAPRAPSRLVCCGGDDDGDDGMGAAWTGEVAMKSGTRKAKARTRAVDLVMVEILFFYKVFCGWCLSEMIVKRKEGKKRREMLLVHQT